ncbi:MAG: hypothetical protein ACREP7_21155 [Lysobacter sp.]
MRDDGAPTAIFARMGVRGVSAHPIRAVVLWVGVGLASSAPVQAQKRILPASAPLTAPCVQVRIGNDEAGRWSCLNEAMKAEVKKTAPIANTQSPGEALAPIGQGLATPAATRQRMGDQYGKSVVPQRPVQQFPSSFPRPVR